MDGTQPISRTNRLYADLASLWPVLSPALAYQQDSLIYRRLLYDHAPGRVHALLDLGCGAGYHARFIKDRTWITGVDLSEPMLEEARRFNPRGTYVQGDIRTVRLGQTFDAVLLLDALNYLCTRGDLLRAFVTAFEHLPPKGLLITQADFTAERFPAGQTFLSRHEHNGASVHITEQFSEPGLDGHTYRRTFFYRIEQGGEVRHERDEHLCGLFPESLWCELISEAGFLVRRLARHESGCDAVLFIGLKPAQKASPR